MSDSGLPLLRPYVFCGVCALLAAAYGYLAIQPSPGMLLTIRTGPAVGVAAWLTADARRTRAVVAQDAGLFFYMTWPLTIWWYARRSRGPEGWRLAARLYALALAGVLGLPFGELLADLVRS
jgi:hypothetical protein